MSANTAFLSGDVATTITVERFKRADGQLLDRARCAVAVSRLGTRGAVTVATGCGRTAWSHALSLGLGGSGRATACPTSS